MPQAQKANIKETITSIIISLALAFTFRGFVIEGFVIPTGSMAPTLHGAYMRMHSPASGYDWAVGPWDYDQQRGLPLPIQGTTNDPIAVTDPMSGLRVGADPGLPITMGTDVRLLGGDRIFVLKYLHGLFNPARFDAVVFRFPGNPRENYIKRLVGLPGEEVALVDGDVFVRTPVDLVDGHSDWAAQGWKIVRKPERQQRQLWMPMFDSHFAPPGVEESRKGYHTPWLGRTPSGERDRDWTIGHARSYHYDNAKPTTLVWDADARPVCDFYAYNDIDINDRTSWGLYGVSTVRGTHGQRHVFPVSDMRASFLYESDNAKDSSVAFVLNARSHQFRAEIIGTSVTLRMKADGSEQWTDLGSGTLDSPIGAGSPTRVEFWHADQELSVWIDGEKIAQGPYEWSPAERIAMATTIDPASLITDTVPHSNPMAEPSNTHRATMHLEFAGSPFTLHRVRLDRDIHYQAGQFNGNAKGQMHSQAKEPSRATHPMQPLVLAKGQHLMCGDNSASSLDGRLWDTPSPWLEANFGSGVAGVVPEELIVGKAFFVYFPALNRDRGIPIPDFGRLRWIW